MSVVIQVDSVSKQYRLGQIGSRRLVDDVNLWLARLRGREDPLSKVNSVAPLPQSSNGHNPHADTLWALKNVSFEVQQGEVLGLIGRNGAGKSTMLKILSRVTAPTKGEIRIKGRIASLLEVGTGFHQEMTGRENIYLNGAILGMTKSEIRQKFDEIVAFSEIDQFIDTPVKRYSSGMYVKLAFAVAAHLDPEILIVDEVLAVGDSVFQRKCLGKMKDVARDGRTILFVSHNMEAVRSLCQRTVWLKNGCVQSDGPTEEVIEEYFDGSELSFTNSNSLFGLVIKKVILKNSRGEITNQLCPGEDLIVEIVYDAHKRVEKPYITVAVMGIHGPCFSANMLLDGHRPEVLDGAGTVSCRFRSVPLLTQNYTVKIAVWARNGLDPIINYQEVASFNVVGSLAEYGYKGEFLDRASRYIPVVVPYQWRLPNGESASVSLST